jgi:protein-tyrosine-phosphatase
MVCTGNICRSPLAEALMRSELKRRGIDGSYVSSAGTGAWDGTPASEGAYLVGLEHDLDLSGHKARLLTRNLVEQSDLILTMAGHQKERVQELGGADRVHLLGEYAGESGSAAEVPDPFGADIEVYRATYDQLQRLIGQAADRLATERDNED